MPGGCGAVSGGCGAVLRGFMTVFGSAGLYPGLQQPLEQCSVPQADPGVPVSGGVHPGTHLGSGAEPRGCRARPMRCVGFPAVLVMNLHEASVSTRRQSMAESTGVNKRWIMRAEGSACRLSWGPGGQRLINAEWHWRPPPSPPLCLAALGRGRLWDLQYLQPSWGAAPHPPTHLGAGLILGRC